MHTQMHKKYHYITDMQKHATQYIPTYVQQSTQKKGHIQTKFCHMQMNKCTTLTFGNNKYLSTMGRDSRSFIHLNLHKFTPVTTWDKAWKIFGNLRDDQLKSSSKFFWYYWYPNLCFLFIRSFLLSNILHELAHTTMTQGMFQIYLCRNWVHEF